MRRFAWPLASTVLALSACNALTGVSDLSTCPTCEDASGLDSGAAFDAKPTETSVLDSSTDAHDATTPLDASGTDADADADAGPGLGCQGAAACVRVMFATSTAFTGNLGGISGADAKCQALADVSTIARIKGRTFLAWVSTPALPVTIRMTHGTQTYIRSDGVPIASSFSDLTDNSLQNPISLDENGGNRSGAGAWTATNSGGAGYSGSSCQDWTSALFGGKGDTGNVGGNGSGWSAGGSDDCSTTHALYCVEK
jgi:hypothetical protein